MPAFLKFRRLVVLTFIGTCLFCGWSVSANAEEIPKAKSRLLNDIKYLASDKLEGRGIGSQGLNLAADFIRDEFKKAGLDIKSVEDGAFQKFTMTTGSKIGEKNTIEFVGPKGQSFTGKLGSSFNVCSFGGSGNISSEIVFCGYGIEAKDEKYNDFAGIDVKGKTVIIMRRVPQQSNPHGAFGGVHGGMSRHAELRTKVSNAFSAGAAAILFVNDPHSNVKESGKQQKYLGKLKDAVVEAAVAFEDADPKSKEKVQQARKKLTSAIGKLKAEQADVKSGGTDVLMKFGYGGSGNKRTLPIYHISQSLCDKLLKATLKKTLKQIETEIDKTLKPQSADLAGWKAVGTSSVERVEADVKNVIGVLEGSGPLADETIVIGAHYDHVGLGGQGSLAPGVKEVHNGADDNASGTVSLLELARMFGQRKEKLPRRLVFIAFTAEERGLIGSARYVKEPVFPLEKTIAMFNMDMVGRMKDNKLTVFGSGTSNRWKQHLDPLAKDYGLKLFKKPEGFGPSDHSSFYGKKIPVLHFFTGTHSDYHRPSDDWEKINFEGMEKVVGMIENIVIATANNPEQPDYIEVKSKATINRGGSRPYFGSIPDFGSEEPGYSISGAAPGSPAHQAGLKGGDRIIKFGKSKIGGLDDFDLALRKFSAGETVDVTVVRDGKNVVLKVTLAKPK